MSRTRNRKERRRPAASPRRVGPRRPPSVPDLADTVVRGGHELLEVDDPLEAEAWASAMLGTFHKVDAPLEARVDLDRRLSPQIVGRAEARGDAAGLAVLEALAAVAEEGVASTAREAAARLHARGIARPIWAAEIGKVRFDGAWVMLDVFGDHEAYFATFHYPGRPPHVVNALYDRAMGEIIKDAFVGYPIGDPRQRAEREDGVMAVDVDAGAMARRIVDAIGSGDLYLDNDWTPEFKRFRALVLARMRGLPLAPPREPREPPSDEAREAIVAEFLASGAAAAHDEADLIVAHGLDYLCDYLRDDPFRWSPIVVEQFLLDFLPRKVSMPLSAVVQLPAVLRTWVRFALTKRGIEERWIVETEQAVDQFAPDFRRTMTDADEFGPAKLIGQAILADGVDPLDQASVDAWVEAFNAQPQPERDALLRRLDRLG